MYEITLKNPVLLCVKYLLFALIAIATNLFSQHVVLQFFSGIFAIYIALVVGTGVGLIVKFILDKKFIFYHKASSAVANSAVFAKYSFTGLLTTAIFWAAELSFHYMFKTQFMTYLGGAIGLSIGYYIKYQCDKKFTFGVV